MSLSIKDAVETSNEYMQYNDEEEGYSLADLFKGLNLQFLKIKTINVLIK